MRKIFKILLLLFTTALFLNSSVNNNSNYKIICSKISNTEYFESIEQSNRRILFTPKISNNVNYVIMAGQSLIVGVTAGAEQPQAPYINPNPNALIVGNDFGAGVEFIAFRPIEWTQPWIGQVHGPELALAYNFTPQKVRIIKVAQGGSQLSSTWADGTPLRNKLIEQINYAKQYAIDNNETPIWSWYWRQWQSDNNTTSSNNYQQNYRDLITSVINNTGITISKHIIHKVDFNSTVYTNYTAVCDVIYNSQLVNAEYYNATIIESDDLPKHDGVHTFSAGYHTIGDRLYNALTN